MQALWRGYGAKRRQIGMRVLLYLRTSFQPS